MVANMSLVEKVSITAGVAALKGCSGFVPAVPSVKFPGLCLSDAGQGLRNAELVSSWPSGIHAAASWNRNLTLNRGLGMGGEFKKKGVNVLLGPVVGPLGRVVTGGRNWEGFSVDPYLSGALVHETVTGIQKAGVITSTKHFIANEQETNRNPRDGVEALSSNIDDRTMHELYLWPFQDAVHAGSGNIMCSYQRINNSYGCANSKTLNGLLKTELGFQGFVVSDWGAQHAGVPAALAGMDMAMPGVGFFWGSELIKAVQNGSVPESRVTDMAVRIVAAWYQLGQDKDFPEPGVGLPFDLTAPHETIDARDPAFKDVLRAGAVEGHVLVKNVKKALPLKKPRMLSVFGFSAKAPDHNNYLFGPLTAWGFGVESANQTNFFVGFLGGEDKFSGIAINGTILSGGGSGGTSQSLFSAPFDAIKQQAWEDDTALFWDLVSDNPAVNTASDACLVIVNAWASEGYDRPGTRDDYTDGLIINVARQCNNTIVVIHNAGVRLVDGWVEHPNVTAVIFAHLPGEHSGAALANILYGRANPSGKLPYTVAKNESDYGALHSPSLPEGRFVHFPQSNFSEGVLVDYRHFDAANITPRYAFGFGLSYTSFGYADLQITKATGTNASTAEFPAGEVREGGPTDLWDVLATVTATVANTGGVDGAEVAQLYVGLPDAGRGEGAAAVPVRQLRGFDKPFVRAGQSAEVRFALTRRDLSTWDVGAQKWRLPRGKFTVSVGGSSRDLPLVGELVLP